MLPVGTGLFLTIRLRGLQFRELWPSLRLALIVREERGGQGDISHFQALMTALAATVGTGNIAGVAWGRHRRAGPGAVRLLDAGRMELVWAIADVFNGAMAVPNLIALVGLSGVVAAETGDYFNSRGSQRRRTARLPTFRFVRIQHTSRSTTAHRAAQPRSPAGSSVQPFPGIPVA